MHTDKGLKGGWFIVRVQMDKTVAIFFRKKVLTSSEADKPKQKRRRAKPKS